MVVMEDGSVLGQWVGRSGPGRGSEGSWEMRAAHGRRGEAAQEHGGSKSEQGRLSNLNWPKTCNSADKNARVRRAALQTLLRPCTACRRPHEQRQRG